LFPNHIGQGSSKPWCLIAGKGYEDPCPIWLGNKCYLTLAFAKSRAGFNSCLGLYEVTPDLKNTISESYTIIYDGHNMSPTIEGPKFNTRNGWIYIMAPAGSVKTGWQVCLRSKNIYGPYEAKIVLLQNDTGQALLLCMIVLCVFAYSGIGIKAILKWSGPILAGVVLLIVFSIVFKGGILSQHQADRFHVMENPFNYESGIGYHLANSLLAIGNGGLFGKGLGNGVMKLGYLPEPHTDFIFAVIAEELGLVGVLFIIGLLMFIVYKGFLYAGLTDSFFFKLVCVGISSYIGVQTFVNLGGISGAIPLTGVPLPFMTFGGSSMLSLSIAIGILLLTAKQIKIDNIERRR